MKNSKKAFSMVELVFVIVVIGILAGVAIPKLAMTRNDAKVTKAKTTVASVRNALATQRQKLILSGKFNCINPALSSDFDVYIFEKFTYSGDDTDDCPTDDLVLNYPLRICEDDDSKGCWVMSDDKYRYRLPVDGVVDFKVVNNRFECQSGVDYCKKLE